MSGWKLVPGAAVMYNLEVEQDHTYTVGVGQWVVHNCGSTGEVIQKLQDAGIQWGKDNHFVDQLTQRRGSITADNIKDILLNGNPVKDTRTSNFGMMRNIGSRKYAIFFDGGGTLMTFLTESELSTRSGRYMPMLNEDLPVSFDGLTNVNF